MRNPRPYQNFLLVEPVLLREDDVTPADLVAEAEPVPFQGGKTQAQAEEKPHPHEDDGNFEGDELQQKTGWRSRVKRKPLKKSTLQKTRTPLPRVGPLVQQCWH